MGKTLIPTDHIKYLGVYLDETLRWHCSLWNIIEKVAYCK